MDQSKEAEDRVEKLKKQREEELASRRFMSSCPDRRHSFGKYEFFEKKVNKKYDKLINDALKRSSAAVSPGKNRSKKRRTLPHKERDVESSDSDSSYNHDDDGNNDDDDDNASVESSFSNDLSSDSYEEDGSDDSDGGSDSTNNDSRNESDVDNDQTSPSKKKKRRNNGQDVIEIDFADSGSDSDSSSDESRDDSVASEKSSEVKLQRKGRSSNGLDGYCVKDDQEEELHGQNDSYHTQYDEEDMAADDTFFEPEDTIGGFFEPDYNYSDEDDTSGEIERYHASKIRQSKLSMAAQGFRHPTGLGAGSESNSAPEAKDYTPFDPSFVKYDGNTLHKNRCYRTVTKEGEDAVIVGIQQFLSKETAQCVLVERFEDTLLGSEDEGLKYNASNSMMGTHVQIHKCTENLPLSKLDREPEEVDEIPQLMYQPQTPGDWHTFGYFYDRNKLRRKSKRQSIRSLDCFAGAGGSLLGYEHNGFHTIMAVENDKDAIRTLKENNQGLNIYEGCIQKFIEDYDTLKCALGRIDHIHFSSPCQDFSKANRSQATGKRDRADLSLLLVDLVQMTSCSTAVFENVVGIWDRKNIMYLKKIAMDLFTLGYQIRCTVLKACDYGDPQKRPRLFMFISKDTVPIPSFPARTHGPDPKHLWPYTTVKEALSRMTSNLPNMDGQITQLRPGQHGAVRLNPYDAAPTIRAKGPKPFHYSEDRSINVREAACLQSFPIEYKFYGGLTSQYRLVGNAVPVELSTAVAQCVRQVLLHEYDDE